MSPRESDYCLEPLHKIRQRERVKVKLGNGDGNTLRTRDFGALAWHIMFIHGGKRAVET